MSAGRLRRTVAVAALAAVAASSLVACGGDDATALDRPNLVLILVDDLDAMTVPTWDALGKTKELIGDRGLTFTNAFVSDPLCCPSRATILTGNYPHNTKVWDNDPPDGGYAVYRDGGAERESVAVRLQRVGYRTSLVGKYLNGYDAKRPEIPPGWDDWFGLGGKFYNGYGYLANDNGTMREYGTEPEDYQTDVLAERTAAFISAAESNDEQPFFVHVTPSAPHDPIPPAPRHLGNRFQGGALPDRPNLNEVDVTDKPTWLREGVAQLDEARLEEERAHFERQQASLLAVDDLVATVVDALEDAEELDDTLLVFTSDNGYNLGAHRLWDKHAPYEESIRVPLVMAGPGVRKGTEESIVLNNDFAPTFLELAGSGELDDLDGESLVPMLDQGRPGNWRTSFLIEKKGTYGPFYHLDTFDQVRRTIAGGNHRLLVPSYEAVRTDRWKYIEWYSGDEHEYELYDLQNDPWELQNVLATADGAEVHETELADLRARLERLRDCSGRACR